MERKKSETHTEEKAEAEDKSNDQAPNLIQGFKLWFHSAHSIYWPNIITGLIILFLGIPVAVYMSTHKGAIYALGIGVSLLAGLIIMSVAHYIAQRIPSNNSQALRESSAPSPTASQVPIAAPTSAPNDPPTRRDQTSIAVPPSKAGEEKPAMTNDNKPEKPSTDNSINNSPIINSPGSVQAPGGNVTINQSPPPWMPTEEDKNRLIAFLQARPKGIVAIHRMPNNIESSDCANALQAILESSGWTIGERSQVYLPNPPRGVIIGVRNAATAPPYATTLQQAFRAIGWNAPGEQGEHYQDGQVTLVVGFRPN